jgi:hypothetical protein
VPFNKAASTAVAKLVFISHLLVKQTSDQGNFYFIVVFTDPNVQASAFSTNMGLTLAQVDLKNSEDL